MLDGILGRGFVPKGKSLIKLTKNRIDVLRRKRTATIKFLKKDLADLLANGLDVNAYGRAGGLLDELKHLWNLDFVEKSCDFIYKILSTMQKMRIRFFELHPLSESISLISRFCTLDARKLEV